ncbi:lipoprotein [Alteromonas sp. ASW11-19]|uniref:Lipoprotein n=1 Tax=Alteromonas salexigens TaxID=2982530 RepID=A0ABT2VPA5_9ALTE|nr:lipoprotein [Alteromonas salexigens]MCU7554723.1 lipoprotein [Alteromonas salexigens]
MKRILLVSVALLLSSCGFRGALYLPDDAEQNAPEAAPVATPPPATSDQTPAAPVPGDTH